MNETFGGIDKISELWDNPMGTDALCRPAPPAPPQQRFLVAGGLPTESRRYMFSEYCFIKKRLVCN
jgi:hypothetical protein